MFSEVWFKVYFSLLPSVNAVSWFSGPLLSQHDCTACILRHAAVDITSLTLIRMRMFEHTYLALHAYLISVQQRSLLSPEATTSCAMHAVCSPLWLLGCVIPATLNKKGESVTAFGFRSSYDPLKKKRHMYDAQLQQLVTEWETRIIGNLVRCEGNKKSTF